MVHLHATEKVEALIPLLPDDPRVFVGIGSAVILIAFVIEYLHDQRHRG